MELEKLLVKDKITVLCWAKKMSPKHYIKLYKQKTWTLKKCQANEFSKTTNYRLLACSKRSDSGERCEVKNAMKVEGDWGERCSSSLAFIFSRSFLLCTAPHYSQLSPCGHPAITDTPIIRTADKFRAKINYRHLTKINSHYYGLSLQRTLT